MHSNKLDMNQKDLDKCLQLIEDFINSAVSVNVYRNELDLGKLFAPKEMEYKPGGGSLSKMIKVFNSITDDVIFTVEYTNTDIGGWKYYTVKFIYNEYTEIINPSYELFEFVFNDSIQKLKN